MLNEGTAHDSSVLTRHTEAHQQCAPFMKHRKPEYISNRSEELNILISPRWKLELWPANNAGWLQIDTQSILHLAFSCFRKDACLI